MKVEEFASKYDFVDGEYDREQLVKDILDVDMTGNYEFEKVFGLRAAKDSEPVFQFTAVIKAKCKVVDAFQRAAQPSIINYQNKNRQGKKETLQQANDRLAKLPKRFELNIHALSEREVKEIDQDTLIAKLDINKMSQAQALAFLEKLQSKVGMTLAQASASAEADEDMDQLA